MTQQNQGIFDDIKEFPDATSSRRFDSLVGLDHVKEQLVREAQIMLDPDSLHRWSRDCYGQSVSLIRLFQDRPCLFLFAGDVGTGKTALAETFGSKVARDCGLAITFYSLSLTARGTGAVGEMTNLLSMAFAEVRRVAAKGVGKDNRRTAGVVLLVDEADALAQSRELSQMHHEDRAGVNALIRGIDDLASEQLPAITVMCTNRLDAIDPAVRRRAAATFQFTRPNDAQRASVLRPYLEELRFSDADILAIVKDTGPVAPLAYGFSYSDLTQRFLPALLLNAYPSRPITAETARQVLKELPPTPPFKEA